MPPKRKAAETTPEGATSTRSTRASSKPTASAKNTAGGTASSSKGNARKKTGKSSAKSTATVSTPSATDGDVRDTDHMEVSPPPAKRARTSRKKAAPAAPQAGNGDTKIDDEPAPTRNASPKVHPTPASNPKLSLHLDHASASAPKSTKKPAKNEPYSVQRAQALFSTYADSDDASVIGPEGFEKLCADAGIPMDGSCPLILAWLMQAKEMGKISKEEWTHGTSVLKASSVAQLALVVTELEAVIIEGKPPIKPTAKKDQEYDRTVYFSYVSNPQSALQKLYHFSYALAKPEQSKNIDMDTSAALWAVLLAPKYPIMTDVLLFISEKGTYRATNKDLWSMMLEFCETVSPTLQDYEVDGAWPTLLDDFVVWKKSHATNGTPADMETDH